MPSVTRVTLPSTWVDNNTSGTESKRSGPGSIFPGIASARTRPTNPENSTRAPIYMRDDYSIIRFGITAPAADFPDLEERCCSAAPAHHWPAVARSQEADRIPAAALHTSAVTERICVDVCCTMSDRSFSRAIFGRRLAKHLDPEADHSAAHRLVPAEDNPAVADHSREAARTWVEADHSPAAARIPEAGDRNAHPSSRNDADDSCTTPGRKARKARPGSTCIPKRRQPAR
jgi:hypothetical protein